MSTAQITYLGGLTNSAVHLRSGSTITTDAPVDNQGKGQAFSPTDLLSVSLVTCMMTVMGILAEQEGYDLDGMHAEMTKEMDGPPRKVGRIKVDLHLNGERLDATARMALERAALNCPVALSLHPDLAQDVAFLYDVR
ncbi:MAG: OsmC family protein [Flavobacteriales bacterium]|nr:OsmC family protein [Flavobacteriales bacterium]